MAELSYGKAGSGVMIQRGIEGKRVGGREKENDDYQESESTADQTQDPKMRRKKR